MILDIEAPVFVTCPTNISVNTEVLQSSAVVSWQLPEAMDNLGQVTVTCDKLPGSTFFVGHSAVTCVAIDKSGNSDLCTFYINVEGT